MKIFMLLIVVGLILYFISKAIKGQPTSQANRESNKVRINVTPDKLVPMVIEQFEVVSENEIGGSEAELVAIKDAEEERALLYALRVSKIVPKIKSMKSLANRWNTACEGAAGYGLNYGTKSSHHQRVLNFLSEIYLQRFAELTNEMILKASNTADARKTLKAKQNSFIRVIDNLKKYYDEFFEYELPGLKGQIDFATNFIKSFIESITISSSIGSPSFLRALAINKAKNIKSQSPLFLDTETTGLRNDAEVVEIAIIDSSGSVLIDTLVKPTRPIPPDAERIHGISNEDVKTAPNLYDVWNNQIKDVVKNKIICIYNFNYDSRVLLHSLFEYGIPSHGMEGFCVMKLVADIFGRWDELMKQNRWIKLQDAADRLKISLPDKLHRASSDAQLTRIIFNQIAKE
jgi:DNA polymerase-3 subunit epsilon